MIITITGTPGTGKSYLAARLAGILGFELIDLNKYIILHKLYDNYDRKARTHDVEVKSISKMLNERFKKYKFRDRSSNRNSKYQKEITGYLRKIITKYESKNMTIEKFLKDIKSVASKAGKSARTKEKDLNIIIDSHLSHYLNSDFCIVVKSSIKDIYKRLRKRPYTKAKIEENIESEIFDICLEEAKALNKHVLILEN